LLAYLDTPWRFHNNPRKLWKYCGVGLIHSSSGRDKNGLPKKGLLQLAWAVNRRLKDAVMGSAISAIRQGDNVFADYYERLVHNGLTPSNARHTVARKMLTVMWGMWKTNRPFDEQLVCSVDGAAQEPAPRIRCNRSPVASTAPDGEDRGGVFRVTHAFHPLHGRQFPLVTVRHNWTDDRVYYHDPEGRLVSIPAAWTDVRPDDPFVLLSAGRSAFRPEDLLELVRMVSALDRETPHGR
jgi:hypothetical protein